MANYAALPPANTASGKTYSVLNSQGTNWLPGSLGGTYYSTGFYYSDGTTWNYMGSTPYQASQSEVDTGTDSTVFVTPLTFEGASKWATKQTTLTSGSNIKTINGASVLGSGDLVVTTTETDPIFTTWLGTNAYQPIDADLTAIAALTTNSFGRDFCKENKLSEPNFSQLLTGKIKSYKGYTL